ncbi:MAG: ribosome biogenesis GTP-binding protein YihA/YsxC [Streptococcaceae bacterium]|jgi:GTP-binding protein|nr:ribosome biogenesis GTP-binding protein YihA/YsxC [Streptococcaceae bacterium]
MNLNNLSLTISAASEKQWPVSGMPEIALAGRSNVGKSSFINTLLNRKNFARTSSTPGKTQLLNFYNIDDSVHFVDVPGYGYARVSKKERERWGAMIEDYLTGRENLQAVVSLVDFRHKPTEDDITMYRFLKYYKLPVIVIATKCDKVTRNRWSANEALIKKTLQFDSTDDFVIFSSETKYGREEAWQILEKYF